VKGQGTRKRALLSISIDMIAMNPRTITKKKDKIQ